MQGGMRQKINVDRGQGLRIEGWRFLGRSLKFVTKNERLCCAACDFFFKRIPYFVPSHGRMVDGGWWIARPEMSGLNRKEMQESGVH